MNDEDIQSMGPDAFDARAESKSAGVDGEVETVSDENARQEGFVFGTREGCDQSDRADGKHE